MSYVKRDIKESLYERELQKWERQLFIDAINKLGLNQAALARFLGLSRATTRTKLIKHFGTVRPCMKIYK